MIIIKHGHVVDPLTGVDGIRDIIIKKNRITHIGEELADEYAERLGDKARIIDASGLIVAPGLMDAHVHFRDPGMTYKENIITGTNAAKKGGFTTVVCMANTNPPVDNVNTLYYVIEKGESTGIHVRPAATVTVGMRGEELVNMTSLAIHGACVFTDDGIPIANERVVFEAFKNAKELNVPVSLHEEDPEFVSEPGVNYGAVSLKVGYGGADRMAEDVMVARDCVLALRTGAKVCIQHISSRNSVEIVRTFKRLGANIHAEATPHHFTLTEEAVLKYGTNAKMNPPLRTEEDRRAIIAGLQDGTIDMIVTDHAPHSKEEKEVDISEAPSGIIGLETSLGLAIKGLVEPGHITLMELIALMSSNPANFYGLREWKIEKDSVADIVIFGEREKWKVGEFASKSSNSPFIGWELPGKVHYTICEGKVVYEADK